ncbi:MAG: hypothetical protein GY801_36645 [bacterium]|nr:hypothetical protein [bacterium]
MIQAARLHHGKQFDLANLEQAVERVKQLYADKGYLEVEFTDEDLQYNIEAGEINTQLTLREGKHTSVHFEGNARIHEKKLRTVVELSSAEDLHKERIEEHAHNLIAYYKERGFHFVNVSSHQAEDEQTHTLTFVIEEGSRVQVRSITIEGNEALTTEQLRKQMFTKEKGLFSRGLYREAVFREDLLAIKGFYQQQGYFDAEVVSTSKDFSADQAGVAIHLIVEEGIQTHVGQIDIQGEPDEETLANIRERLSFQPGEPLNKGKVEQGISPIEAFYHNQGYINARVVPSIEISEDKRQASVTFRIEKNQKFYIGNISIQGVDRTRKSFVTRALQINEGALFQPEKIRATERQLDKTDLYESATFHRVDPESDRPVQDMLLSVNETATKVIELRAGYGTEDGLQGSVEVSDKNLFN